MEKEAIGSCSKSARLGKLKLAERIARKAVPELEGIVKFIKPESIENISELIGLLAKVQFRKIESLDLGLSFRTRSCLKSAGIETINDLITHSESELLNMKNFGPRNVDEIKEKLNTMGLHLRPE